MTTEDPESAVDFEENNGPSKSQLKRDALAVRDLGSELAALGDAERARVPLPDDIVSAIVELNRTTRHGARKRQLGWLAKRLRQVDIEPIEAALESFRQRARANTQNLHLVERWRDQLLGLNAELKPQEALTAFLENYPQADRQLLRQLQRNALKEQSQGKPPRSARLLFKSVRDAIIPNEPLPPA